MAFIFFRVTGALSALCCIGSAAFLVGTIYLAKRMTVFESQSNFQGGSLNLNMIFLHIFFLVAQTVTLSVYYITESGADLCIFTVFSALLDIFLCTMSCVMIYEAEITSLIAKGGHLNELYDTVSTSSEISSGQSSTESDGAERDARLHRQLN